MDKKERKERNGIGQIEYYENGSTKFEEWFEGGVWNKIVTFKNCLLLYTKLELKMKMEMLYIIIY